MIPKWTGSIPIVFAIGRRIGVRIMIFGMLSRTIPNTKRITFMTRMIANLLLKVPRMAFDTSCGYCMMVRQRPNAVALAMIKRIAI